MTRSELLTLLGPDAAVFDLKPPFRHCGGFKWTQDNLPAQLLEQPSDSGVYPTRSALLVCENDTLLGPGHALDVDVTDIGKGHYLHWADGIYFSASDNSNPNLNGRSYSVIVGSKRVGLVGFGSCHVEAMLRAMTGWNPVNHIYTGAITHYTGEMIQFVRYCRGQVSPPSELLPFMIPSPDLAILNTRDALTMADGMILEICNTDEILYGEYFLNRNLLDKLLVEPIQKLGHDFQNAINDWYYTGILGQKEEIRASTAAHLLKILPPTDVGAECRRNLIEHMRGRRQDESGLKRDISTMRELVSPNTWVLSHILRYMPDGRPMYWPPAFMRQITKICRELGLPLVDTAKVVEEKGVEFSLLNERYYTQAFINEMGERLYQTWLDLPKNERRSSAL